MDEENNVDNIHFPAQCIVCNSMLQINQIQTHKFFFVSTNVIINENGDLVPQFENETIMNPSTPHHIPDGETVMNPSTPHHIPDGTTAMQLEDIEEILIAQVQKRRELWDHKLPISTRSREVIASHWEEISKELNGIITPFIASKKWRYLRDSYMRIRNEQLKKKVVQPQQNL